jgi:hypothetical protein
MRANANRSRWALQVRTRPEYSSEQPDAGMLHFRFRQGASSDLYSTKVGFIDDQNRILIPKCFQRVLTYNVARRVGIPTLGCRDQVSPERLRKITLAPPRVLHVMLRRSDARRSPADGASRPSTESPRLSSNLSPASVGPNAQVTAAPMFVSFRSPIILEELIDANTNVSRPADLHDRSDPVEGNSHPKLCHRYAAGCLLVDERIKG